MTGPQTTPTTTRSERRAARLAAHRAQQAAAAEALAAQARDERARALQAALRHRRRHALIILAAATAVAVGASWGAARMAEVHPWSQMRWMIGFGGRGGGDVATQHIAAADAWWFVLAVQSIPVALAGVSLTLSRPHRARESTLDSAPMWLAAALAPAFAICLLGGFATHATGQSPDDLLPSLAALAPQLIPMAAVLTWVFGAALRMENAEHRRMKQLGVRPRRSTEGGERYGSVVARRRRGR